MDVGQIIKTARLARGMTQEELADKVGVQKSAVAKWETGRVQNIKRSSLQKLAIALNIRPVMLLGAIEIDPLGTADALADILESIDDNMKQMILEYNTLDSAKQAQVREYVHLLFLSSKD